MNITINTEVVGSTIVQDTFIDHGDGLKDRLQRQVADTQDAQVRAALVKLGWTPPPEAGERCSITGSVIDRRGVEPARFPAPDIN